MLRTILGSALALFVLSAAWPAAAQETLSETAVGDCAEPLEFTHVLSGDPLPVYKKDEEITDAVETFHCTGENPYSGDEAAIADGKKDFKLCGSCHNPDGTGRIGPNIVDDQHKYERVATPKGEFEVIYGGAAGAMQPMGRRFTQDQILKIMAYVETLGS